MTARVAGALGLIVAWCRLCAPEEASSAGRGTRTVELRLTTYDSIDVSDVALADQTLRTLLGSAGVGTSWVDCSKARDRCVEAAANTFPVRVNLLPVARQHDGSICGEATRDALTREPTVLVYVPRSRDLVHQILHAPAGRSSPLLSTLQAGHLVGLTIAHEVGHVLGVAHGARGVMNARPTLDDIVALRASRLTFSPREGARMRSTMATR